MKQRKIIHSLKYLLTAGVYVLVTAGFCLSNAAAQVPSQHTVSSPGKQAERIAINPQPEPPGKKVMINPQPEPPGKEVMINPQPEPPGKQLPGKKK